MISADLGKQLESFVGRLVASGRYNSKSEVLREGVRLIEEREAELTALDASIARGLADVDAGSTRPAGQIFDRLEAKYRAMIQQAELTSKSPPKPNATSRKSATASPRTIQSAP